MAIADARISGAVAAGYGALAVFASAMAAHAFELDAKAALRFETATRMCMLHALALLMLSVLQRVRPALMLRWVALGWHFGVCLFCGALYVLALGGPAWFSKLAPVGGISLIFSWLLLAWAQLRLR